MKFKAAILTEQKAPLIVDEVELINKLEVGQVLVKLQYSGICGSQIGEIEGVKGPDKYLPHLLGHEGSAIVVEIGPGVTLVNQGDHVVLHWMKGRGIQSITPTYKWGTKKINAGWLTTFNEYAVISENRCTKISKINNLDIAALFGCAITTGFGVIENNVKLKMGESIVVFGAGGIGLNIIQAAKLNSAWPIIAVDIFDNRLKLALELGATHIINSATSNPNNEIGEITLKNGLDVFIDNTGIPNIIELGYKLVSKNGRVVLVGVPKRGQNINIFSLPLHFGKTIIGSHGGEINPSKDIMRYFNLHQNNLVNFNSLITNRFSLDNINKAIETMKNGQSAGRILIEL
tara:strand:+ start:1331 stop:2368 length:1038 start_codon:yes stop_codon:yes gene_type:complete